MNIIFFDIGIMVIIATITAFLAQRYKQPLIPAYILAGLILGPGLQYITSLQIIQDLFNLSGGFGIIHNNEIISTLSEIGIAFLLFIVGLEIDFKKIKDNEKVTAFGSLISVVVLFTLGFIVAKLVGVFTNYEAIYMGFIVAFSSTMVVLKILSDRKEIDTLHGRIIIGILLIQDLIAVIGMLVLSFADTFSIKELIEFLFWGACLVIASGTVGKLLFPIIFKRAAKNQEMLLVTSLCICFLLSILFEVVGFSIVIGAFFAGILLGNLPYSYEIMGRVKSLRDFFSILFFVSLGYQLNIANLSGMLLPFFAVIILVVILKPIVILAIMFHGGYKKRTSFLSAISLAQTSEFSLIMVTHGLVLGHVTQNLFSFVILLTIFTIFFSSYFIRYENKIYNIFHKDFDYFEKLNSHETSLQYKPRSSKADVLLVGYSRTGYSIYHKLVKMKRKFIIIDFNPDLIRKLIKKKIPCIYGDVSNPDVLEQVTFHNLKFVISTIPDPYASKMLIHKAKKIKKDIAVFVTSYHVDEAMELYEAGADYVILPHFLGGEHASILFEEVSLDFTKLMSTKTDHLKELRKRKKMGHEYPAHHKFQHHKFEHYQFKYHK